MTNGKYPKIDILLNALSFYNMRGAIWEFIDFNENIIYKVKYKNRYYCYRIHLFIDSIDFSVYGNRLHTVSALYNEMDIINLFSKELSRLNKSNENMQIPQKNINGEYVTIISNIPITVLSWVEGIDFDCAQNITNENLISVGQLVGQLHMISQSIKSKKFSGISVYGKNIIETIESKFKNAYRQNIYDSCQYNTVSNAIQELLIRMNELDNIKSSFGLIHADLSKSNLLINNHNIVPIDFCLCGYGYYYHDLGSLFLEFNTQKEQELICNGYFNATGVFPSKRYIEAFEVYHTLLYLSANINNNIDISWLPANLFKT